jgi:hypothetical protein
VRREHTAALRDLQEILTVTPFRRCVMKIEYVEGDHPPLPLVRLYEFRSEEVKTLCDVCNDLADGRKADFSVHEQSWAQPVNGCRFIWRASKNDVGVRAPARAPRRTGRAEWSW